LRPGGFFYLRPPFFVVLRTLRGFVVDRLSSGKTTFYTITALALPSGLDILLDYESLGPIVFARPARSIATAKTKT
jgi:hypothetical protein